VREGGRDYRQKKGIKILNLNSTADTSERGERKKDIMRGEREKRGKKRELVRREDSCQFFFDRYSEHSRALVEFFHEIMKENFIFFKNTDMLFESEDRNYSHLFSLKN